MSSQRNASIDVLRGIAILLVLGAHYPYYAVWTRIGWAGVNLFFVLSGFLVSGLLFDSFQRSGSVRAVRFFIRRGFKIWPSFYILLIVYALVAMLRSGPYPIRVVLDAAAFIQNYTRICDGVLTAHIWSLCVEEHFYVVLPLLFLAAAYFFGSNAPRGIAAIAVLSFPACFLLRLRVAHDGEDLHQSHLLFDTLLFGVFISYLYRFQREAFRVLSSSAFALLGLICLAPILLGLRDTRLVQTVGITSGSLGFGLLLCWGVGRWPANPFASAALRSLSLIGFYSYPIYLWHVMVRVIVLACIHDRFFGFWIYTAGSVALGATIAKITEQPFLHIRDRLFPDHAVVLTPNSAAFTPKTVQVRSGHHRPTVSPMEYVRVAPTESPTRVPGIRRNQYFRCAY